MSIGTTSDLLDWEKITQSQIEQTWGQIDHKLISLKSADITEEIRLAREAESNRIRSQQRSNQNFMAGPHLQVAAEIPLTNEWVEKLYAAYCDVWTRQGKTKTPVFIRCVFHKAIEPLIEMRKHNALSGITQELLRTGRRRDTWNATVSEFERELTRSAGRWRRKFEIEARECQHALGRNNFVGDDAVRSANSPIKMPTAFVVGSDAPVLEGRSKAKSRVPKQPALTTEETQLLGRKLKASASYPTLSVKEVAAVFGKSESTIYRWVETNKLKSSGVSGRVLTKSVNGLLRAPKYK